MSEQAQGIAKKRREFIKESEHHLTSFERFSHKMLAVMYKSIFWLLIPFVLLIFIVDGFNLSVLFFLGVVFFIFVPIMKQNEKRLEVLIQARMEMEGKGMPEQESLSNDERRKTRSETLTKEASIANETEEPFVIPAISINMGANSFFVTLISIFITFLFVWSHGWGSSITQFFLFLSIVLLVFSFWFPYSNFVKRRVEVREEMLKIGKRDFYYREIKQVLCRGNGNTLEFHLTYTKEPTKIRPENAFQQEAKEYIKRWCEQLDIPFKEVSR